MKRIIDGMSAQQIADGWTDERSLVDYLESLCKPEPNDEEYISRLERAVQVLANSNSDWEMNVSVWDTESILSVLDDMSPQKLRKRMMQPAAKRRRGGATK